MNSEAEYAYFKANAPCCADIYLGGSTNYHSTLTSFGYSEYLPNSSGINCYRSGTVNLNTVNSNSNSIFW